MKVPSEAAESIKRTISSAKIQPYSQSEKEETIKIVEKILENKMINYVHGTNI